MTMDEAQVLIFNCLCEKYRQHGEDACVLWRGLPEQLGIQSNIFGQAMDDFVDNGGGLTVGLTPDRQHITLGPSGRGKCKEAGGSQD